MSNLRSIVLLGVTTWAFVVCFAVWVMFGVIGISIKNELGQQRYPLWPEPWNAAARLWTANAVLAIHHLKL